MDSDNSGSLLEDLGFYIFVMAVIVALFFILLLGMCCNKVIRAKGKWVMKKLYDKFVFNGTIRSITIIYIKLCISSGL